MKNQDTSLNPDWARRIKQVGMRAFEVEEMLRLGFLEPNDCLLYTSPSPRDGLLSRMPSSA